MPIRSANRVLIVKPSGIGNMVMFTPALQLLKKYRPQDHLTMVCHPPEAPIVEDVDYILLHKKDEATGACDPSELETALEVYGDDFDVALYPPFTSISKPTEYLKRNIPLHITHPNINYLEKHEVWHNIDVVVDYVGRLGIDFLYLNRTIPQLQVPIDEEIVIVNGAIVYHTGASNAPHMQKKRWAFECWGALLKRFPNDWLYPITPRCSLSQTAARIKAAKLFIGTDSGPMHIAAAVGTPIVALFGPTLESKNAPWMPKEMYRIVRAEGVDCAPCYADPKKLFECQDVRCMREITVDQVYNAAMEVLNENFASR